MTLRDLTIDCPDAHEDYLALRAEIPLPTDGGKLNEAHLPPAQRRGIYPTPGHEAYVRRGSAETDRMPATKARPGWQVALMYASPVLVVAAGIAVAWLIFTFFELAGKALGSL